MRANVATRGQPKSCAISRCFFFFSSRRRHTRWPRVWSSDVCSSDLEVRDARTNAQVMAERRDTLVKLFSRHGYRTVALMPGLLQTWPEGSFYGFDQIYGASQLEIGRASCRERG